MPRSKVAYITLRTRVPKDIGEAVKSRARAGYPSYRVVRDIIVAAVAGSGTSMNMEVLQELSAIAKITGYSSVDALVLDLANAFLRVYRYNSGELADEESTPDEDIREMFNEMEVLKRYEEGLSIRKGT